MENDENLKLYPPWKQLYSKIAEDVQPGDLYDYDRLQELMGLDPRNIAGRGQVLRFAKELLTERNLHMENERNIGYRVVAANEHVKCSLSQVKRARRRVAKAGKILAHTRMGDLTDAERTKHVDLQARFLRLAETMATESRRARRVLAEPRKTLPLPHPLKSQ